MTSAAIRDQLITYLAAAGDKEVKEFYSLLKGHLHLEDMAPSFSKEQLAILEIRRKALLTSTEKGIDRVTLHNNVININC